VPNVSMLRIALAIAAVAAQFGIATTAFADAAADQAYAYRCEDAYHACKAKSSDCTAYRNQFNAEGSVCPDVNAASNAPIRAPTVRGETDGLAEIQAGCDANHGYNTFGSQVKCIKSGIQTSRSMANADSGVVQLYVLTADKLVDDVARKQITVAAARVELQRAYLDFRDRTNRKIAEASERENAVRPPPVMQQTPPVVQQQPLTQERAAALDRISSSKRHCIFVDQNEPLECELRAQQLETCLETHDYAPCNNLAPMQRASVRPTPRETECHWEFQRWVCMEQ
jgi:hypothetical protein